MLIDAAKGLEPQTLKLFQVCKHRGIPVITVINKWDRPGREPLELLDEIAERIGLLPTPLFLPVGIAGDFRGLLRRGTDGEATEYIKFTRTAGGATIAPEEYLSIDDAEPSKADAWETAAEESELLSAAGQDHDQQSFLAGITSPVIYASANAELRCQAAPRHTGRRSPRRLRSRTDINDGTRELSLTLSVQSCSRSRPASTPLTATAWPSCASCRASSNAA